MRGRRNSSSWLRPCRTNMTLSFRFWRPTVPSLERSIHPCGGKGGCVGSSFPDDLCTRGDCRWSSPACRCPSWRLLACATTCESVACAGGAARVHAVAARRPRAGRNSARRPCARPVLAPPVVPTPLTLPLHPGQELVDATAALMPWPPWEPPGGCRRQARRTSTRTISSPKPPRRSSSTRRIRSRSKPFLDALLGGNIPPPLPVDPLALLRVLPDGLPRITYRLCSELATKAVTCSLTLPLGVPAIVDVTGDRSPDVLAHLLPAVSPSRTSSPPHERSCESKVSSPTPRPDLGPCCSSGRTP